jgi:hypothetical protein
MAATPRREHRVAALLSGDAPYIADVLVFHHAPAEDCAVGGVTEHPMLLELRYRSPHAPCGESDEARELGCGDRNAAGG